MQRVQVVLYQTNSWYALLLIVFPKTGQVVKGTMPTMTLMFVFFSFCGRLGSFCFWCLQLKSSLLLLLFALFSLSF